MNARYVIHPDQGYVDTLIEGSVTLAEFWAHTQRVWSDPAWKSEYNGLIDFSRATIDMSDDELRELMKTMLADPRCSLARWAFVVTTAMTFAWLRKVDQMSDQQSTFRIFFSRKDAEDWLLQPQQKK